MIKLSIGDTVKTPNGLIGVVYSIVTNPLFTSKGIPVVIEFPETSECLDGTFGWWYQHDLQKVETKE